MQNKSRMFLRVENPALIILKFAQRIFSLKRGQDRHQKHVKQHYLMCNFYTTTVFKLF